MSCRQVGLPALLGERRLVQRTALAARQQAADPVQQLHVEVEALVLHPDLRAGEHPLDHAGEPEDRPEAQPQGRHPQARADHGHTLRRSAIAPASPQAAHPVTARAASRAWSTAWSNWVRYSSA